jgi:hypothetical protein
MAASDYTLVELVDAAIAFIGAHGGGFSIAVSTREAGAVIDQADTGAQFIGVAGSLEGALHGALVNAGALPDDD